MASKSKLQVVQQEKTVMTPSLHGESLYVQLLAYVTQTPGATYQEMAVNFQTPLGVVKRTVQRLKHNKLVQIAHINGRAEVCASTLAVWRPQVETSTVLRAADLFCGAGGFSSGLALELEESGKDLHTEVDLVAINHDEEAINAHQSNHPWARHCREDIAKAQPRKLFPGGHLNILLASPSCTHFSTARGDLPVSDQLRTHAWQVVRWARDLDIECIIVENVKELTGWGPTRVQDCKCIAKPDNNGRANPKCRSCKGCGRVTVAIKDGSIFRKWIRELQLLGYTVEWKILNAADYGDPTSRRRFFLMAVKTGGIPWPKQTHSKDAKVAGTVKWVAARTVIDWSDQGESIFLRKKKLCRKTILRIAEGFRRYSGIDLEPFLIKFYGTSSARPVDEPLDTVTAGGGKHGVVMPVLVPHEEMSFLVDNFGSKDAWGARTKGLDEPVGTITGAQRWAKVDGVLQPFMLGQQSGAVARSTDEPMPTVATAGGISVVQGSAFILPPAGVMGGKDRSNKPRSPDDPLQTVTQRGGGHLIQPMVMASGGPAGQMVARSTDDPVPTILGNTRLGVVQPFLVPNFGEAVGQAPRTHDVNEPLPAPTSHGAGGLVQGFLTEYYGNGGACSVDLPLPTATTKARFGLIMPQVFWNGQWWVLDIRFRMLRVPELAGAMSFPAGYRFTGTKGNQIKQIGNAVAVKVAKALCGALLRDRAPASGLRAFGVP